MLNLRLKYVVLSSLFYGMLYAVPKANYMIKHREKYSEVERFAFAKKIINLFDNRGFMFIDLITQQRFTASLGKIRKGK